MRKTEIWLAIALVGLVLAGTAMADPKRINGAMCELEYDYNFQALDRGAIRIGAPQGEVGVVCPLLRANTTNTNGLLNLIVNVYKVHPTTFTCYGESYDQSGSPLKIVSRSTTSVGRTALIWNNSINTSSARGTYGVICYPTGTTVGEFSDEIFAVDYDEP